MSAEDGTAAEGAKKQGNWFTGALKAVANYFTKDEGETHHLEPYTGFALGLGLTRFNFGLASDLPFSVADMLSTTDNEWKKNGRLILDFDKIAGSHGITENGLDLNMEFAFQNFIQVEVGLGENMGLGISLGSLTSRFDLRLNEKIFKMLADGIKEGDVKYGASVSGAVFAESLKANWHQREFVIPKLFASFTLSHYLPIVYIPKSNLNVHLRNTNEIVEMGLEGEARVYLPFNVGSFGNSSTTDWGGLDLSLQAEYALFPILDVGITVLNIPFIPSALHTSSTLKFDRNRNSLLVIEDLVNGDFNVTTDKIGDFESINGDDTKWVVRPMRWDFYALYRPLRKDFLVIRPNIGFTVLNPSEEGYFNIGLQTSLNAGRIFTFSWFTGGYDGLCRNTFGFDLRLWKIARWFANLEMRSQTYGGAWTLKGASVELGFKWGGGFNGVTNF
jgi:hypothetical protein